MLENTNLNEETNEEQNKLVPMEIEYKELFRTGIQAYEKRDYENASKVFMEIYEKFPEQPEALVNYADCQYELFNVEEAVKYWQLAKEKDKYLINPYLNLGRYYLSKENYKDAIKEYVFAFCLNPHNESTLIDLAVTYEKMRERKKAFLLYEFFLTGNLNVSSHIYKNIQAKVTKHKLNSIAQMRLGVYFEKNGFWRKAIQAYYDSIRVFPNFTKTYSNVGNIFYKLEKYDYAKLYWLEAFKMDKTNIHLILNLALCCEKLDDCVNAFAFYTKFVNRSEGNIKEIKSASLALKKIQEKIKLNSEYIENHKKICEEYYNEEKFDDALIYYKNLYKLTAEKEIMDKINKLKTETNLVHKAAFVSFQMAQELFEKGNYELAIEKCKMANSLWKNSYFEQDIRNLLVKCQTAFGKSLNNMIKQRY